MDIPLEIAFHNVEPSADIENLIREHVNRLEKLYPHLVGCRVSVEMRHKQHRNGNVPEVHIAVRVPGREIAISREPHRAKERLAAPNVHTSVKDAFRAAEKRLKDFKQQQYGEVKTKEVPIHGYVASLFGDYGFIATGAGEDLYFHRNALADGGFDDLHEGDAVQYTLVIGDNGPGAGRVWRTAESSNPLMAEHDTDVLHAKS